MNSIKIDFNMSISTRRKRGNGKEGHTHTHTHTHTPQYITTKLSFRTNCLNLLALSKKNLKGYYSVKVEESG